MQRHRFVLATFLILTFLFGGAIIPTLADGPYDSFSSDPLKFWPDNSTDIDSSWSAENQTVTFEENVSDWREDFTDIEGWIYSSSGGLAGGDHGLIADGGMGNIWMVTDDAGNEFVQYKIPFTYAITSTTVFELYYRTENAEIRFGTRIVGAGLDIYPCNTMSTSWAKVEGDISGSAGKTTTFFILYLDDVPNDGPYGNFSGFIDYIHIWDTSDATLDVGVPLSINDDQEILCAFDASGMTNTSSMAFMNFSGAYDSGFGLAFNSTGIGSGPIWIDHGNYTRVTFEIDNQRRIFSVQAYDEVGIRLLIWETHEYLTANDWLNFTCVAFVGQLTLFGLSGSTDYRMERVWGEPKEWYMVTNDDYPADIQQGLWNWKVIDPDGEVTPGWYDVHWRREFTYFSWLRLIEDWMFFDDLQQGRAVRDYIFEFRWRLWYPNGTEHVDVTFRILWGGDSDVVVSLGSSITIEVDGQDQGILINMLDSTISSNGEGMAHIGLWRTLDDRLGVMFSSDCFVYVLDGQAGPYADIEQHEVWVSEDPIDDWQNSTVDIRYYGQGHETDDAAEIFGWFDYEGVEWNEYTDNGVAEVHFSSTWWDLLGPTNPFNIIGDVINWLFPTGNDTDGGLGGVFNMPDFQTTWQGAFNWTNLENIMGGFGADFLNAVLLGTNPMVILLNQLLQQLPEDIADALGMGGFDFNLGGLVLRGVVGAFGAGFVALFDTLGAALGIIGSLVGVILSLFVWVAMVVGVLVEYFMIAYAIVEANITLIGFFLAGFPVVIYMALGEKYARDILGLYKWAFFGTLQLAWDVFFGVINAVGNWMPFT